MVAFSQRAPAAIRDISHEPQWGELGRVLVGEGICAALSAPVEVDGSAIGTLDIYRSVPWDWDGSEMTAVQTYAGLVASLLTAAVTAQLKGRLADVAREVTIGKPLPLVNRPQRPPSRPAQVGRQDQPGPDS